MTTPRVLNAFYDPLPSPAFEPATLTVDDQYEPILAANTNLGDEEYPQMSGPAAISPLTGTPYAYNLPTGTQTKMYEDLLLNNNTITPKKLPTNATRFDATISRVRASTWVLRWTFNRRDPRQRELAESIQPGDLSVFYLDLPGDHKTLPTGRGLFSPANISYLLPKTGTTIGIPSALAVTNYSSRGCSGKVRNTKISPLSTGESLLEVYCSDWRRELANTSHEVGTFKIPRQVNVAKMAELLQMWFWWNSQTRVYGETYDGKPDMSEPTNIGHWLLRLVVSGTAKTRIHNAFDENTYFQFDAGSGSMLDTLETFTARTGTVLDTTDTLIKIQAVVTPGVKPLWTPGQHYLDASYDRTEPIATQYVIEHQDAKFNGATTERSKIRLKYIAPQALINRYGIIEKKLSSSAPKAQPGYDENDTLDRDQVIQILANQAHRRMVQDTATDVGDFEMNNTSGSMVGRDWIAGQTVDAMVNGVKRTNLYIAEQVMSVSPEGGFSSRAGVGQASNLAPGAQHSWTVKTQRF